MTHPGWKNRFEWRTESIRKIQHSRGNKTWSEATISAMKKQGFNWFIYFKEGEIHWRQEQEIYHWTDKNITGLYSSIADLHNGTIYFFNNEDDVLLFKLTWLGACK